MKKIDQLLNEYGESHQNSTNKLIHWFCVPAIFFSILTLFWSIPAGPLALFSEAAWMNWATLILVFVLLYYIRLSPALAVGMGLFSLLCIGLLTALENWLPWSLWKFALVLFTVAWIGQFYGHKIEGKKPSFLKDVQFLLIGPAWLMHFIYRRLGISYSS